MKIHSPSILAAATAVMALSMLSSAAHAASTYDWDRKSYTGAQCQPAYGIQSNDFTIYQGRLRNDAAGLRWVSCAITFDAEDGIDQADTDLSTPAGGFSLRVWLDYSGVPAGAVTTNCTIAARDPYGLSATESASASSGATASPVQINFAPSAFTGTVNIGNDATIQVSCLLPSKVAISAIKVYEDGRTDEYTYSP